MDNSPVWLNVSASVFFHVDLKQIWFSSLFYYLCQHLHHREFSTQPTPSAVPLGKKRAWVPDEKEAYIEIEIKEISGDKVTVETKDGRVSDHCFICSDEWKNLNY